MVKTIFAFAVLVVAIITIVVAEDKYTTKYDNLDLDEILHSKRLVKNYVKCFMSEGPCTPDGQEIKDHLEDALQTDCTKCSQKQKDGAEKTTNYVIDHYPEDWDRLKKVYDPEGKYYAKYEASKKKN